MEGRKDDTGKLQWHLLPWKCLEGVVRVLMLGAKKYAPENWKKVNDGRTRYMNAAFRHLTAYAGGEDVDPDDGFHHIDAAICNLLFLRHFITEEQKAELKNKTEEKAPRPWPTLYSHARPNPIFELLPFKEVVDEQYRYTKQTEMPELQATPYFPVKCLKEQCPYYLDSKVKSDGVRQ